jgi:CRP-like cAMP-binding protein
VRRGEVKHNLYFIVKGECSVMPSATSRASLFKLSEGSVIGEECIYYDRKAEYDISVVSDRLKVYKLHKRDIEVCLSDELNSHLKTIFSNKEKMRAKITNSRTKLMP